MEDFRKLLNEARAGSGEAATLLVDEYGPSVQRAVRRVLHGSRRLRVQYDTDDFTQYAWEVLFRRFSAWEHIESPEELVKLLIKTAINHFRDQRRHFEAEGGCRAVSLDDAEAQAVPDCGVSPDSSADFRDRLQAALVRRPAHHREIIARRRDGYTCREIARIVGRSEGQVRRILQEIVAELAD